MSQSTYRIILSPEHEGSFTVNVPSLPECITYGNTHEDALTMAREAIELYIDVLKERILL